MSLYTGEIESAQWDQTIADSRERSRKALLNESEPIVTHWEVMQYPIHFGMVPVFSEVVIIDSEYKPENPLKAGKGINPSHDRNYRRSLVGAGIELARVRKNHRNGGK